MLSYPTVRIDTRVFKITYCSPTAACQHTILSLSSAQRKVPLSRENERNAVPLMFTRVVCQSGKMETWFCLHNVTVEDMLPHSSSLFFFPVTIIGGIVFLAFAFSALFISPDSGF